jgi:hypothetical protein
MHVLPTKRTSTGGNVQQCSHRYAHVVSSNYEKTRAHAPQQYLADNNAHHAT